MGRYILKKAVSGFLTIFFITTFTFFAMHAVPGDPLLDSKAVTPEIRANLEEKYGLNKPLVVQYFVYLKKLAHGDFGISFTQQNRSVNDIIREHFPISATLGILALCIATIGGVLWGSLTALYRNRAPDAFIMFVVILCVSVPGFVFAAVGQFLVTEVNKLSQSEILPVAGWGTLKHMLLPSLVLGLATMAFLTRLMRSSMLEILNLDFVKTAKAKGASPFQIFFKHLLRNAILPVVTYLGPSIAYITTGGFVTEVVFAIPGMGRYFVQAVQQLDYTVIMGLTVFYGSFLVLMVTAVDIAYVFIDPRIRVGKSG